MSFLYECIEDVHTVTFGKERSEDSLFNMSFFQRNFTKVVMLLEKIRSKLDKAQQVRINSQNRMQRCNHPK